jgi:ribosomal-protein-alanine N-acetyltransferase
MQAQLEVGSAPKDSPIPSPVITTTRLIIRGLHPKDAPSIAASADSPAIAKYMANTFPNPYTQAQAESWIALNYAIPHPSHFAICEASSPDIVIGGIGLKPGSDVKFHTAEMGFWVGEKYWGKGYTTEALEAFTNWSFNEWEGKDGQRLRRIWGGVFTGNSASMRCFEKCGYNREGVMKEHIEKDGVVMDMHLFGLTKRNWETRKGLIFNNY